MKNNKNLKHRVLRGLRLVAVAGAMAMYSATAMATVANDQLPTNPQFTANIEKITSANGVMTVDQNQASAAIKWDTFNVGANATINFNMKGSQNGTYNILNYSENAGMASEIYGRMKAGVNANVWLVNPNGVIIGKGAQIDVGHMHLVAHKLDDSNLAGYANGTINNPSSVGEHTAAELMSMGNMYVNSISFDGNRVVLDADKLYTYAGAKVQLGEKGALGIDGMVHKVTDEEINNILNSTSLNDEQKKSHLNILINKKDQVDRVFIGENGYMKDVTSSGAVTNNTAEYASAVDSKWTGDTVYGKTVTEEDANGNNVQKHVGNYLTVSHHARELVVGYTAYDEDKKSAYSSGNTGTYENSNKWQAIYTTLASHEDAQGNLVMKQNSERVGFAWVEDSEQLERIGEGEKVLSRDFALKDGIAAVNTKDMNGGKGFNPIGDDLNSADPSDPHHHGVAFTGKFDGLNYDIYGLTINRPDANDVGLFGHVGDGAVIRNVNLVSGAIVGNKNVGGVVGHAMVDVVSAQGSATYTGSKGIIIENVKNSARVLGVENVGGIVGNAQGNPTVGVNIINAENVALIRGNVNVGGIVGAGSHVNITGETYNTGAVKGIENYKESTNNRANAYTTRTAAALTEDTYNFLHNPASEITSITGTTVMSKGTTLIFTSAGNTYTFVYDHTVNEGGAYYLIGKLVSLVNGSNQKIYESYWVDHELTKVKINGTNDFQFLTYTHASDTANHGKFSGTSFVRNIVADSYNVGGIAGTISHSTIGNAGADDFTIYNDVEIKAAHTLGGIVGAMTNSTVQNVLNNGLIEAKGYVTGEYTYYTSYNGDGVSNGKVTKQVNVANIGGIVGTASGDTSVVNGVVKNINAINNVTNTGDVLTTQWQKTQKAITGFNGNYVSSDNSTAEFYYNNAGNVGGVVGSAKNTNIDNATNSENKVYGAHNVGGVAGVIEHSLVSNSLNDGGEIKGTGAIKGGATTTVVTASVNSSDDGNDNVVREAVRQNGNSQVERHIVGNIGGIVGYLFDDTISNSVRSQVSYSRNSGVVSPGDIVDENYKGKIYDINTVSAVGGIVGKIGKANNSVVDINAIKAYDNAVLEGNHPVENKTIAAATVNTSSNTGEIKGFFAVGGVVGQIYNGEIASSYNLGNVRSLYTNTSGSGGTSNEIGGLLGDGMEWTDNVSTYIYNSYNAGVIGDAEHIYYGRHIGGIAGRFSGAIEKVYNTGDIYNASDTTGGLVGYLYGNTDNSRNANKDTTVIKNSFNTGNITVYAKEGAATYTAVGGIAGTAAKTINISNVYNLGVLRSFDNTNQVANLLGGIVGRNSGTLTINNAYSTGELYAGTKNNNGGYDKDGNNRVYAIAQSGNISNSYYIKPEGYVGNNNNSSFSTANTNGASSVEYADRYDIAKYANLAIGSTHQNGDNTNKYASTKASGDAAITREQADFRMYLYDQADGETLSYKKDGSEYVNDTQGNHIIVKGGKDYTLKSGTTNQYVNGNETITVVATLPVMNEFLPLIYNMGTAGNSLKDKIGTGINDIKYVQLGNEYNPLQNIIKMNSDNATLNIDYAKAKPGRSAQITMLNGNLNIYNIDNPRYYFSGNYVALNGDVVMQGSSDKLYLSSSAALYGNNVVVLNTSGLVDNGGTIYAMDAAYELKDSTGSSVEFKAGSNQETVIKGTTEYTLVKEGDKPVVDAQGYHKYANGSQVIFVKAVTKDNITIQYYNPAANNGAGALENRQVASGATVIAKGIENLGAVTASSDPRLNNYDSKKSITINAVGASAIDKSLGYTDADIINLNKQLANKKEILYAVSKNETIAGHQGNVTFSTVINDKGVNGTLGQIAAGETYTGPSYDVNLRLGNNKVGKITTEGNLTVIGDKIYSDADMKIGVDSQSNIIFKGSNIGFDFSNMGATLDEQQIFGLLKYEAAKDTADTWIAETVLSRYRDETFDSIKTDAAKYAQFKADVKSCLLNEFARDFSSDHGGQSTVSFSTLNGAKTDAMLILDFFNDDNSLNLKKYDIAKGEGSSTLSLQDQVGKMNISNGTGTLYAADKKRMAFAVIENVNQLGNIQAAYEQATGSDKTAIMGMNYTLKNSLDASEVASFKSLGLNADGTATEYTGVFDGRGNNINSVSPKHRVGDREIVNNTGLFAVIGTTGVVKNLNINASRLESTSTRVGIVAGTNKGVIENVNTYGNTIKDTTSTNTNPKPVFIGDLVGLNEETGIIVNSKSEDIVYSDSTGYQVDVGGIAGMNAGILYQVTGKSDVSVADGGATSLGGVVGVNVGYVKDAVSIGVTAGLYDKPGVAGAADTYRGADNVGGIAGENRTKYLTKDNETARGKDTHENTYSIVKAENGDLTFTVEVKDGASTVTSTYTTASSANQAAVNASAKGGTIADAYNDSHVKGWSNTGGVVGHNFGANEETEYGHLTMSSAANAYYVANAGDVIAGDNAGGLAGVNNGNIKGNSTAVIVTLTDNDKNVFIYNVNDNVFVLAKTSDGADISDDSLKNAAKNTAKAFYDEFIADKGKVLGQTIYGRNSGKIIAKSGLTNAVTAKGKTTGTNVGGLIGISGSKADVDHLLNGKAASVYGKVNVGGLIGLNEGILQNSVNLMQNNEISGALNVGGIVGENSGIIAKIENTNKFNITVNKDYVNLVNGALLEDIVIKDESGQVVSTYHKDKDHASYFGGILGHNAADGTANGVVSTLGGIVADVVNTANVTIEHPADYVGGVMGKNDGTIGYAGMNLYGNVFAEGYLRNDGAVGVINGESKGDYIGGVIGQNNKNIYMTDITNSIQGTVYGYYYVGGIIGQNNATVSGGRDRQTYNDPGSEETGDYYKYDIYNNGKVTGMYHVGGLIGENANNGVVKLAYNTGVVNGFMDVGGIVGVNNGTLEQIFNSTAPYDKDGNDNVYYDVDNNAINNPGVVGTVNVGGLVGQNTGTISNAYNDGKVTGVKYIHEFYGFEFDPYNIGSVVGGNAKYNIWGGLETGENAKTGSLRTSWANAVIENGENVTLKLVGDGLGTIVDNFSVSTQDAKKQGIKQLTEIEMLAKDSFSTTSGDVKTMVLTEDKWAFYNNASTPLLKNFLTKAYFVADDAYGSAFTYNGKNQGAYIKVENGHVNVYKVSDNQQTDVKLGEIFAANANGDHSIVDYLYTRGNDGNQLIVGKDDGVNAGNYSLLYSNQINTYYNRDEKNSSGVKERVVNPNMLGYEFFVATLTEEAKNAIPKKIFDPGIPDYKPNGTENPDKIQSGAVKLEQQTTSPKVPSGDVFTVRTITDTNIPLTPSYDINRVVLSINASDVTRVYGQSELIADSKYKVDIEGKDDDLNVIVDNEEVALLSLFKKISETNVKTNDVKTDTSLSSTSGKVTEDVGNNYNWTSNVVVTTSGNVKLKDGTVVSAKDLLANYTFADNKKADFNSSNTVTENLGFGNSNTKVVTGNAKVIKADLVIKIDDHDAVTYGDAKPTDWSSKVGTDVAKNDLEIANGDKLSEIVTYTYGTDAFKANGNTNNVGTYAINEGVVTQNSKYSNYNVTFVDGSITVNPKVLTVKANDITRVYGNAEAKVETSYVTGVDVNSTVTKDSLYGYDIEGWAYGEGSGLKNKVNVTDFADGALASTNDNGKITNNVNRKSADGEGGYNWSVNVRLADTSGTYYADGLQNYTFVGADNQKTTTTGISQKSYVTPYTINMKVADIAMIYGATETATTTTFNELYASRSEKVYEDNVKAGYEVVAVAPTDNPELYKDNKYNGDDLSTIVNKNAITWTNSGFYTAADQTQDQTHIAGHTKNVNVGDAEKYELIAFNVMSNNKNYVIDISDANRKGNVTVKHAILTGGARDIYRYYGDTKKYYFDEANDRLVALEDGAYGHGTLSGFKYSDASKWADRVHLTNTDDTVIDEAVANVSIDSNGKYKKDSDLPADTTKNVGQYVWVGGNITIDDAVKTQVFENYRFWDEKSNQITDSSTVDNGAHSYVLPQKVVINLKDQAITYGDVLSSSQTNYISDGIVKNVEASYADAQNGKTGDFVTEDGKLTINGISYDINSTAATSWKNTIAANEITYTVGKAYTSVTGDGHTNNASETPYTNAVTVSKNITTKTIVSAYTGTKTYNTFGDNKNFDVEIVGGNVTVKQKELTVKDLSGSIVYGAQGGASAVTNIQAAKLYDGDVVKTVGVYGEDLGFYQGTNVDLVANDGSNFMFVANGRDTADVGTYNNSISRAVGVTNTNYKLVGTVNNPLTEDTHGNSIIAGVLSVTPANLVINLNDFKVLYGDTKNSQTINDDYTRNKDAKEIVNTKEKSIKSSTGLVNGDEIAGIDTVISINEVNNTAFEKKTGGIVGTKDVSTNNVLYASKTNMSTETKDANGNVISGTTNNYTVTINNGSVDVLAKQVVVIDPGKNIPNPGGTFDPTKDDPTQKYNPDAVYVKAEEVRRTYGTTSGVVKDDGSIDETKAQYEVIVEGLAAWEATDGKNTINPSVNYANDGGLTSGNTTNYASDSYKWNTTISDTGTNSIAGLGTNYVLDGMTGNSIDVQGKSIVDKAKLTIQLSNKHDILYGTSEENIIYDAPTKQSGTYSTGTGNQAGLAQQDIVEKKTWADLFEYADVNTGYVNGIGQDVTYDNGDKITYYHNAGNAVNKSQFTIENDGSNGKTKATGVSYDGNYDVTILSGEVTFQKRTLTNQNFAGNDVQRTYGNTTPSEKQHATIVGGLALWDNDKDRKLNVKDVKDGGLNKDNNNYTNNVGEYTWSGTLDSDNLPDWVKRNYNISGEESVQGASDVNKAELNIHIGNVETLYGSAFDPNTYYFNLSGVTNGDDYDFIKGLVDAQKKGYVNNQAKPGPQWTGPVGYYPGDLLFGNMIDINLDNYTVIVHPGDVSIKDGNPAHQKYHEDIYPWLHRTNGDHGWGHQDHERERKAEVRFVDGGADFFNDRKDEKEEGKS